MVELTVKVSGKGQILIPKVLRERYGITEGHTVRLEPTDEGLLVRGRPSPPDVMDLLAEHRLRVRNLGLKGSKLGELEKAYLEMEFEEGRT